MDKDKMTTQGDEFEAVDRLAQQWKRIQLTPVVDNDYPAVRHDYDSAVQAAIRAFKANGRSMI